MLKKTLSLICVLNLFISSSVFAQFEGYLDLKMSTGSMNATTRQYISKGNMRSEASVNIPGMGNRTTITIFNASNPDVIITLNEQAKTYVKVDLRNMPFMQGDDDEDEYSDDDDSESEGDVKIEKLGKAKVLGKVCEHVRITSDGHQTEMWITKDVLGYDAFKTMTLQGDNQNRGIMNMMNMAELQGFPLKMVDKASNMTWEVVKIKQQDVPASKFSIPDEYKEAAMPGVHGISPQQRQKMEEMMKQMQKKYQGR